MSAPSGWWPTEDQILLLRAALLDVDPARAAWDRWRAGNTLDTADPASVRLLPLVYRNLRAAGLDESDLARLKGAYRAAWVRNQLLFRHAADAFAVLDDAGVPTLVLKGVALSVANYHDDGARPMEDIDVLVPRHDFDRAIAALSGAGWTTGRESMPGSGLKAVHAEHLQHRVGGHSLDLHRYALAQAAVDDPFWSAAVEIELLNVRTRALSPADQLLHVCVHGARWNPVPPVRWLADAVVVERSAGGDLDWDRVVDEASRRELTASLVAALECLVGTIEFQVPASVLERLQAAPKSLLERWAQRAALRPMGGGNWLPVIVDDYIRQARVDRSLRPTEYLHEHFGARTGGQLASRLVRKTAQVALTQSAKRIAPGRVVGCATCGRLVVTLRSARPVLCKACAATNSSRHSPRRPAWRSPAARSTRR